MILLTPQLLLQPLWRYECVCAAKTKRDFLVARKRVGRRPGSNRLCRGVEPRSTRALMTSSGRPAGRQPPAQAQHGRFCDCDTVRNPTEKALSLFFNSTNQELAATRRKIHACRASPPFPFGLLSSFTERSVANATAGKREARDIVLEAGRQARNTWHCVVLLFVLPKQRR